MRDKKVPKIGPDVVGTPDYMAPEMINSTSTNTPSIDWWAIGCIIYEFIVGIPPFNDTTLEKVWENAINRRINWPGVGYEEGEITPEAKDLIERLLEPNPILRLTSIEDFKKHKFFEGLDWNNLQATVPPFVPKLNNLNYDKSNKIPLETIFEPEEENTSNNKMVPKFKRKNIETVRTDVLHENNLNYAVETG